VDGRASLRSVTNGGLAMNRAIAASLGLLGGILLVPSVCVPHAHAENISDTDWISFFGLKVGSLRNSLSLC
jgi:hypothetical protein